MKKYKKILLRSKETNIEVTSKEIVKKIKDR